MSKDTKPPLRLGFLGTGWIGRHRMQAVLDSGLATVAAIAEPDPGCLAEALAIAPGAESCADLQGLLERDLDGVVIATPSAAHASQSMRALQCGVPVFCQKPLGRNGEEVAAVVAAAAASNRLLGVDLSYRHLAGMEAVRALLKQGALGRVYAVQSTFHNAYGPDKAWFYQRELAGGGCLIDLGVHLIDLGLWLLDFPVVEGVHGRCFTGGEPLAKRPEAVEDYASAHLDLAGGVAMDVACSWNLPLGADAEIGLRIFGTEGSIALRNVDGSFYDFVIERFGKNGHDTLATPPDPWGGRALVAWARQLRGSPAHDPDVSALVQVADVLDRIYEDAALAGGVRPFANV
ncbi:Gfo/Idh/MocA family oxidoreductase [Dyella sp.]|jgi:predicted dehydrogenase|uniref:Gfo/Idh/MocA family protein n=1 Tax=Dyella sp. TaxID=1869338 RepID=UPI002D7941FB|nr:Gfo/Idh/MocA family oxidoreductase [Dyella sp.]HET6433083.1 Gfo/Idh/MocA family oxidoreductase [Dyella sp.]